MIHAPRMSKPDLVAAARALAPELERRTAEVEAARRLPADLSAKLGAAGFYRAYVPEAVGGDEQSPADANAGVEELARWDASAAWVAFIGMTSGSGLAGLPEAAARAIFTSPDLLLTGVFAPMGRAVRCESGAFRVTGRWPWGSGSHNASFILGGCRFFEGDEPLLSAAGAPRTHMVVMPRSEVTLLDNWDASGLCGTGSGEFEVDGLVVPEDHVVGFGRGAPSPRPLYQFPRFGLLALGIGAVALGTARGAIDDLIALATEKRPMASRRTLAERGSAQSEVALAEAALRSARLFFYDAIDRGYAHAMSGSPLPVELKRDLRLATSHAVRAATETVDRMYHLGGGSSVHRVNNLQRRFRDVHVATQHMMVAPPTLELVGKTLLGVDADTSQL